MDMPMATGTPWLDMPLMFEGSREYECSLNDTALCEYQQGYWRFWYEADHRYAVPTTILFCAIISVFTIAAFVSTYLPRAWSQNAPARRLIALNRFLSYRSFRISRLNWNSAPAGVLLLGAVGGVFFFAMTLGPRPYYWPDIEGVDFGDSPPIATRSDWMALACLPFVIATSSKSNIITFLTGVAHEKLQVFHRWVSYAMYVLALVHAFPFIVYNISIGEMQMAWNGSLFYWTGVVALLGQTWLTFASMSPLRNWSYEFFKFSHYLAALVFILFLFFHCDFTLTSWDYFVATGVIFAFAFLHSQVRVFAEHGVSKRVQLSIVSNGFIRVAIPTRSRWNAGQHYFIRFPSLGVHALSSHPFTICSLPQRGSYREQRDSELVFFIRPQGGLTARLVKQAENCPEASVPVLLDGPYGGCNMQKIANSDRLIVVAGGSGAGFILPLVECLLRRLELASLRDEKTEPASTPSIRILLATRDIATRHWFKESIAQILAASSLPDAEKHVPVEVFYTGAEQDPSTPGLTRKALSGLEDPEKGAVVIPITVSSTSDAASGKLDLVQITDSTDRPNLPEIIATEASQSRGSSLGVFVCGPKSMQSDVSNAAARENLTLARDGRGEVYLHMEHFSWA